VSFLIRVVIDPKESGPTLMPVNPTVPARIQARSRADRRLQSMTLGAAALGIVATGAFGYAAAMTYTGKTSTVSAADQPASLGGQVADPNIQNAQPNSGGGVSGGSGSQSQGGTVSPFFQTIPQQPIVPQRHHATSGGS
jgi:hypothetical protein